MCVSGPEIAVPAFLITVFLTRLVTSFGLLSNHLLPFPTGSSECLSDMKHQNVNV